MSRTHEVLNQPPPLLDYHLAGADPVLAGGGGHLYGTLSAGLDLGAIIEPAILTA